MNEERLKKLKEWEAQKPDDAFFKYAISQEYISAGDDDEGKKYLEQLAANFPDYLATYYQLGKLYERLNERDKAIATYNKGKDVARIAGDNKTQRELNEALSQFEDE
jgi:tetratricopeptide (TPR) repeat protein